VRHHVIWHVNSNIICRMKQLDRNARIGRLRKPKPVSLYTGDMHTKIASCYVSLSSVSWPG
jgi:hypothetical protein